MQRLDPSASDPTQAAENRSYCKAAFESLHVAIGGAVKPCCEFKGQVGDVKTASLGDIWTGARMNDLREKMQRAERDDGCRKCYDMEAAGGHSLRQYINGATSPRCVDDSVGAHPKMLDLRLSNRCNLKCRTCGPDASSKWYADAKTLGWKVQSGALIDSFGPGLAAFDAVAPLLDTIEQINFAGGEPLILEEHYALIDELIRRGRTGVRLFYTSNMMELGLRKKNLLALWSQFPNIVLIASIDGHRQVGELVRDGISWDRFTDHVSKVRAACPHVKMAFNITVSIFNVHSLPDLCRSLGEIEGAAAVPYMFNVLQEPRQLSIQVLPADMKAEIQRRLEEFARTYEGTPGVSREALAEKVQSVVSYMNFRDGSKQIKQFRKDTLRLDELRGQHTAAVIPELAPILRETFVEGQLRKARDGARALVRRAANAG